ncbi:MAG: thiamine phosphate synthase [Pseudomonadota bacterium]
MVRSYSGAVRYSTPLAHQWLISDARNDAVLEDALRRMTRGSGFIYRHYHLGEPERYLRFRALRKVARACGHTVIVAQGVQKAAQWQADGAYGPPCALQRRRTGQLRLATAHNLTEIGLANRIGADAVLLSPVFATRSHPGADTLGIAKFRLLARYSNTPVIALGGMNAKGARALDWPRWAAIDGLS